MSERLYQIIYADPPWRYDFSQTTNRKIENQYGTMETSDICAITVPADSDAALYLWGTAPKLREALAVMDSWGFEYKSHAVWDKLLPGMGFWFRGQHELLLVGTKGNFSPPPQPTRVSSVFRVKRGDHSAKPEQVRAMIDAAYPTLRKLEMFARDWMPLLPAPEGWDFWGDQARAA